MSLVLAHYLTLYFWSKDLDPEYVPLPTRAPFPFVSSQSRRMLMPSSYTLPIHSALVDFLGQLLLMVAYEICILQNMDVTVKEPATPLPPL